MGIDERRELIETFLRRCVTYADASIERKMKRGDDEEIIAKWQAYRDFTEHAAARSFVSCRVLHSFVSSCAKFCIRVLGTNIL